ncbi:7TM diverse intracellular signaling domain-containing protein [Leptospira sp. 96542]|nr:7TM diverse intracellular signaling domain-containing protein [Leptospira sp. 96542]
MKFFFQCIFVFFCLVGWGSIFALPIDITKNWNVTKGFYKSESPIGSRWMRLESLPLSDVVSKLEFGTGELKKITVQKTILVSQSDFDETDDDAISLHIPNISNVYEIYWNGKLISANGEIEGEHIKRSGYRRHVLVRLSKKNINLGTNDLRVLIAAEPGEELNLYKIFNDRPANIDKYSNHIRIEQEYVTYMLLFLYYFVGIYHGLFYWKRKKEKYNLYFALFSVFLATYMIFRSQLVYQLGLDPFTQTKLEYFTVFLTPVWLLLFMDVFFRNKASLFSKVYFYFAISLGFIHFFVNRSISVSVLRIWQLSVLVAGVVLIYLTVTAVMRNNKDARRLLLGIVFLIFTGTWDILGASGILPIQNLNLLRFGFLFFVLGIAVVLANRFLRVHKQVEELNANLERKVEERTTELQKTLTKVQELKVQQDGDYFLTSLLLEPLSESQVRSETVKIESYTKQKKEFEFRGRKREIGGDIIITDQIDLNGKRYLVFVNGDAMGKSIQGAGGALVLGVVFLSFIKRTQLIPESQRKSPERWLKECFYELQTIFESFDGSMLVSVVLGLVEEDSGILYYINAEHPWTVLYRDGIASFIEDELELRKIGTKGMEGEVRIRVFPLEKDDVLYIGSDGRDDLILSEDAYGNRIINEDETKFLSLVKESKGELLPLVQNLENLGALSDDLTLIRLEWLGSYKRFSEVQTGNLESSSFIQSELVSVLNSGNAEETLLRIEQMLTSENLEEDVKMGLLREKSKIALLLKKFDSALESLEEIFPYCITDNEILLQLSYAYRKTKEMRKAIDFGERLRARDPKHVRNLINLIECYRLDGNLDRANKIFKKLSLVQPDHQQISKIKQSLGF